MPGFSSTIKVLGCLTAACGVIGSPHIYISGKIVTKEVVEEEMKNETLKVDSENKPKKPKIIIGKTNKGGNKLSLSNADNIERLLSGAETKLTFQKLKMKLGETPLSANDILFSPCQNGDYYLLKHIKGLRYKLENGTEMSATLNCRERSKYEHLDHIKLDWKKKYVLGSVTLSTITVGSCSLSKITGQSGSINPKLQIECKSYLNHGDIVVGNYGNDNYEYE